MTEVTGELVMASHECGWYMLECYSPLFPRGWPWEWPSSPELVLFGVSQLSLDGHQVLLCTASCACLQLTKTHFCRLQTAPDRQITAQHSMHAAVMVPIFPAFWNQVTGRLQEAWGPAGVERMQGRNPSCRFCVCAGGAACCCKGPHHAGRGLIGERAGWSRPISAGRL